MEGKKQCRKWHLTINNPLDHGMTPDVIRDKLNSLTGDTLYWCFCDEIGGENNTPHVHIYIFRKSPIRFTKIKQLFPPAHIEQGRGTNQENRDYILKSAPHHNKGEDGFYDYTDETTHVHHYGQNLTHTFQESGACPEEYQGAESTARTIVDLISSGASDCDIIQSVPQTYKDLDKIQRVRSMLRDTAFTNSWRDIEAHYIFGTTGTGKTRTVMEKYGYTNVYRVTNYKQPFDSYNGEDVIIFEEFRSSLPYRDMLNYLDGYPMKLPCRYFDRQACFTKVYVITNIPPNEQYKNADQESFAAFWRRFKDITQYLTSDFQLQFKSYHDYMEGNNVKTALP